MGEICVVESDLIKRNRMYKPIELAAKEMGFATGEIDWLYGVIFSRNIFSLFWESLSDDGKSNWIHVQDKQIKINLGTKSVLPKVQLLAQKFKDQGYEVTITKHFS